MTDNAEGPEEENFSDTERRLRAVIAKLERENDVLQVWHTKAAEDIKDLYVENAEHKQTIKELAGKLLDYPAKCLCISVACGTWPTVDG